MDAGEIIRKKRWELGWMPAELAQRMNVPCKATPKWGNGRPRRMQHQSLNSRQPRELRRMRL